MNWRKIPGARLCYNELRSNLADALNEQVLDNDDASLRAFIDRGSSVKQAIYLHGRAHKYDTLVYNSSGFQRLLKSEVIQSSSKDYFHSNLCCRCRLLGLGS